MINSLQQLDPTGQYSYADYLVWRFEERVELLKGRLAEMSAPSRRHQTISGNMHRLLANALWRSSCKVYAAPFELYQEAGVKEYWVVSPTEQTIQVWKLDALGKFVASRPFVTDETFGTEIIPGLSIDLNEVFYE